MKRRDALLLLPAPLVLWRSEAWAGNDFLKRPANTWSENEIQQLLTRSPWAKEVKADFNLSRVSGGPPGGGGGFPGGGGPPGGGGFPGGGGPPGGGPPGGGPGGPGGPGGGPPSGLPEFKVTLRWESAAPLRAVAREPLPPEAQGSYVIAVVGMPGVPTGEGPREESREQAARVLEEIKRNTKLQVKGRSAVVASTLLMLPGRGGMYAIFPADPPIAESDKEVTFMSQMGPLDVKAKFKLKDMVYQGALAL